MRFGEGSKFPAEQVVEGVPRILGNQVQMGKITQPKQDVSHQVQGLVGGAFRSHPRLATRPDGRARIDSEFPGQIPEVLGVLAMGGSQQSPAARIHALHGPMPSDMQEIPNPDEGPSGGQRFEIAEPAFPDFDPSRPIGPAAFQSKRGRGSGEDPSVVRSSNLHFLLEEREGACRDRSPAKVRSAREPGHRGSIQKRDVGMLALDPPPLPTRDPQSRCDVLQGADLQDPAAPALRVHGQIGDASRGSTPETQPSSTIGTPGDLDPIGRSRGETHSFQNERRPRPIGRKRRFDSDGVEDHLVGTLMPSLKIRFSTIFFSRMPLGWSSSRKVR